MRCREYPDQASARAGCGVGEEVVSIEFGGRVYWGVVPELVLVDQGEGREPVRQPGPEFFRQWWDGVISLAEERACTEA